MPVRFVQPDIGRVGHDHIEDAWRNAREQIRTRQTARLLRAVARSTTRRTAPARDIGGQDLGRAFQRECHRDGSGTAADVDDAIAWTMRRERRFDHMLGLGAGNQDVGRDREVSAVEFLCLGDVLRGLAADALVQVAAEVNPGEFGKLVVEWANR